MHNQPLTTAGEEMDDVDHDLLEVCIAWNGVVTKKTLAA